MQIFNSTSRSKPVDIANGCQMMSYSHVEKDLNKKEHLNLNLG